MSAATQEPHSQRTQAICRVGTLAALAHSLLMEERFASSAQLRVKDGNASDVPQTCTNPARQAIPASASLGCSKDQHRREERREATARNVYNCDDRRIRTYLYAYTHERHKSLHGLVGSSTAEVPNLASKH